MRNRPMTLEEYDAKTERGYAEWELGCRPTRRLLDEVGKLADRYADEECLVESVGPAALDLTDEFSEFYDATVKFANSISEKIRRIPREV